LLDYETGEIIISDINSTQQPNEDYTFTVTAEDLAGNTGEQIISIELNSKETAKEEQQKANSHSGSEGADRWGGGNEIISDTIYGNGGNDTLSGGGGDDKVFGGEDQDLIAGDNGNDKLYGDNGERHIDRGRRL